MKTLFFVRHAKSDWDNSSLLDIERPLNERGYREANHMSLIFKERAGTPDLIISSPAIRAMSTALIFARNLNYDANLLNIQQELYNTSMHDYLSTITKIDPQYQSVALVAHNPTISDVANSLCQGLPMEMSTCAIAGIRFNTNQWLAIEQEIGKLILFEHPKK